MESPRNGIVEAERVELNLLGPMAASRGGVALRLPPSRKARGLLAYLALASAPVSRAQLCEVFWDQPGDPRGELRWCLSKLRGCIDDPGHERVLATHDTVSLDLAGCMVDAVEAARAAQAGVASLDRARQRALAERFRGEFLEGLEIDRSAQFSAWLTAQRRRFRGIHVALLEQLVQGAPAAEALRDLEAWLALAPFDRRAHELLLGVLARSGRLREGEEHLARAVRLFELEGLHAGVLVQAWQVARGEQASVAVLEDPAPAGGAAPRRASIAVMPFQDRSSVPAGPGGPAHGLAHDVITRLAKLRTLFVIAQGTVFALHERRIDGGEAGRTLNVDYVVSGSLRSADGRLWVAVELVETRSARIVWAEIFNRPLDDAFAVLEEIGNRIVASVAAEIEAIERNRAVLRPPSSLDAWEAYHRGLWHMYRFERQENEHARQLFETAIRLDPTFSRAHAGLSFTYFQDAFQQWADYSGATELAIRAAGQGLMADDRDPAAHWAMGRALWLRGSHEGSVNELSHAVGLSPNFALGHYNLAFVHSTAGDPLAAIAAVDYSRDLSPFDPMLFGMLGTRAMALVRLGRFEEAAGWAAKAAARPNAFPHIHAMAAYSFALAGDPQAARPYLAAARQRVPGYGVNEFLRAFRFDEHGEALFREGARRLG